MTSTDVITDWKLASLSNLSGKCYLITGGNSGVGYETAVHLRRANADVVIACRSATKGAEAISTLRQVLGSGFVKLVPLDLFVGYLSGGGASNLPVALRTAFSRRKSRTAATSRDQINSVGARSMRGAPGPACASCARPAATPIVAIIAATPRRAASPQHAAMPIAASSVSGMSIAPTL